MKLKLLASVAAAGLFAAGAASAEPNGWYGAIDAGYHMIDDINAESSTTGANWNWEVNDGWAASMAPYQPLGSADAAPADRARAAAALEASTKVFIRIGGYPSASVIVGGGSTAYAGLTSLAV